MRYETTERPYAPFAEWTEFGPIVDGDKRFVLEQASRENGERNNDKRYAVLLWDTAYGWWRADFETDRIAEARSVWNKCKKLSEQGRAWSIMRLLLTAAEGK